jgi:hypothetical protein
LIERVVSLRNRSNDRAMTYAIALRSLPAREDVVGFVYHTSPNDSFGRRWYATRNEGGAERDVPGWWITRSDAIVALLDAIGFNWREVSIEGVRAM